jgi:hypothetical protein
LSCCRVGAILLATLIAVGVSNANAQSFNLNTTDDSVSIGGMLFAKLETLRAQQRSGEAAEVCHRLILQRTFVHVTSKIHPVAKLVVVLGSSMQK